MQQTVNKDTVSKQPHHRAYLTSTDIATLLWCSLGDRLGLSPTAECTSLDSCKAQCNKNLNKFV